MAVLSEYIQFLSSPKQDVYEEMPFSDRLKEIVPLFFMVFLFVIFIIGPIVTLVGLEGTHNKIEDLSNLGFENEWANKLAFVGLAVLLAPLIEEIFFRFPLRFKLGSVWLAALAFGFFSYGFLLMIGMEKSTAFWIGLSMVVASFGLVTITNQNQSALNEEVKKWFPLFFYAAAFFFAFAHLANYELDASKWMIAPVLVLPQLILGFMLGYIRLKHGLLLAMLVHAMNNFIPSVIMIFIAS